MTSTPTRRCRNWLKTYEQWSVDRCAAPKSFLFWSGIFCLSAALRRKVCVPKSILGAWNCWPHLYIFLVGPPGTRKNTAMGFSSDILSQITDLEKPPEFISAEALSDSLAKSPDCSLYLHVEEFGDLIMGSGPRMYEFLTSCFDGKKELRRKTLTRGLEYAHKPCVNGFFGTTPEWIAGNMPEAVIGGGFASRCIFVAEEKARDKRIFFSERKLPYPLSHYHKLENDLVIDLQHIASTIEGEFTILPQDQDWFELWHAEHEYSKNPKLQGYNNRKITLILKLSQLVHVSYSDNLVLSREDIETAIDMIESIEEKLPSVFDGIGKNKYVFDVKAMVQFVKDNPGVRRDKILKQFENVATPALLAELLDGLLITSTLKSVEDHEHKQVFFVK